MIISGGLDSAGDAMHAYEASGADAVMIARGSLGNPWIFEQLTGRRSADPERDVVIAELRWVIDRAEEHLGPKRAARYLRKFYPWYLERLGADKATSAAFQQSDDLDEARGLVDRLAAPVADAALFA
jgi:tRNA-dihydrouridine synthase B